MIRQSPRRWVKRSRLSGFRIDSFNPNPASQTAQKAYLATRLNEAGIPTIQPAGGHAVYVVANQMLTHIPNYEFPAQSLEVELYREGGIRGVEIGSVMFACHDPADNTWHYPALELLRLAIPRRNYTQSHFDYVRIP